MRAGPHSAARSAVYTRLRHCPCCVHDVSGNNWWPCTHWDTESWAAAGHPVLGSHPGFDGCSRVAVVHDAHCAPAGMGNPQNESFSENLWRARWGTCSQQCQIVGTPAQRDVQSSLDQQGTLKTRRRHELRWSEPAQNMCYIHMFILLNMLACWPFYLPDAG